MSQAAFSPKIEAPGLGLVAVASTAPSATWYEEALASIPGADTAITTRLKNTIEALQIQRANLLNQVDELRGELAEAKRARNSANERMAELAQQLDTAWLEIARLTKGLA